MGRGKVQLKRIQNPISRQVTFSKRKAGLLKKATELSVLCDAEVALIIFSPAGKQHEFASPSMNRILGKYQFFSDSAGQSTELPENVEVLHLEVDNLQKKMTHLEKLNNQMIGEDLDSIQFKDLQHLEKRLNLGARKIRSKKQRSLKEENANLRNELWRNHKTQNNNIQIIEGMNAYCESKTALFVHEIFMAYLRC